MTESKKGNTKPAIGKKMIAIMKDVEAITKDRQADVYKFRGIDDVYNSLHDIMAKHGVFMIPKVTNIHREERTTAKGNIMAFSTVTVEYVFSEEGGSYITAVVVGEGMDRGDKSVAKAMSMAQKYALFQIFLIPTAEVKDSENDSPELADHEKATATPGGTIPDFRDEDPDPVEAKILEIVSEIMKDDGERKYTPTQIAKAIQRAKSEGGDAMDRLKKKMADELQVQASGKDLEPEQKELGDE